MKGNDLKEEMTNMWINGFSSIKGTPNISFAIEAFAHKEGRVIDCRLASEESLRAMITRCEGNVILRSLTGEESSKLKRFKEEQNGK